MQKGEGIFGKQYEIMHQNDTHADGSVDRILCKEMIKLDDSSVEYLYNSYTEPISRYKKGSRVFLESIVNELMGQNDSDTVDNIVAYCKNIVDNCDIDTEDFIFGGIEEELIERGTCWCTDTSRVACILFQIAGFPSRIINTVNTKFAYSGHTVTEVYYNNKWGVADPVNGTITRNHNGTPVSAWEIHNNGSDEQFESIGISNYYADEKENYQYETSRVNDYYREILKHSDEQWSDGIRWIHGEDLI